MGAFQLLPLAGRGPVSYTMFYQNQGGPYVTRDSGPALLSGLSARF
jgi:hypothetical protein